MRYEMLQFFLAKAGSGRYSEVIQRRRLSEVFTFEQQRLARHFGEGIGEAVAEVQARRMTPLTKIMESLPCDVRLFDRERLDYDTGPPEEHLALAVRFRPGLALEDNREFQTSCQR